MIQALMIEDDGELADILKEFLAKHDINVKNYQTPDLGLSALRIKKYDIIILDLSLPDMDGTQVCKEIRKTNTTPIIISSARSDLNDKVTTFTLGADDYLPKPYDPQELVARIMAILRRVKTQNVVPTVKKQEHSDFVIKENAMEISLNGVALKLTRAEYGILEYLIKKRGLVVSREDIMNNVDAISYESSEKTIDVIISRLRAKTENDTKKPKYIVVVRGIGYKLK